MALGDILGAIREESEGEIRRVSEAAAARVTEVHERAQREAAAIEDQETHARDRAGSKAADRIVNQARLDADRMLREAREEIFRKAMDGAAARLEVIRTEASYGELLDRLLDESRAVLPTARVVKIDPRDTAFVSNRLRERGVAGFQVESDLETWGGLELWSDDGRRVTNTLESRMHKATPHIRSLAAEVIPELRSTPS